MAGEIEWDYTSTGAHGNNRCCFNSRNAETNNFDDGNGHMGAVHLGKLCSFSLCSGSGPYSGKCVNVVSSSTTDGALLEQRTCTAANSMLWSRTVR